METKQQAEPVELSDKKIEQLSKQPIIESFVSRSQDGVDIINGRPHSAREHGRNGRSKDSHTRAGLLTLSRTHEARIGEGEDCAS